MRVRILKAMHSAGQRLSQRGVFQGHMIGHMKSIFGHNTRRDANELGIGTVVEEQLVAKILLPTLAKIASAAGSRVERDNAVAVGKTGDALASLDDGSGQLVAKKRGGGRSCARDSRDEIPSDQCHR